MTTLRRVAQATFVAALLAIPLALAGCISGPGPITVETRETRPFTQVEVGAGIRLAIAIGPAGPLEVSAQQNVLPAIATDVSGDTLRVGANEDFTTTEPVTVTMSAPSITGISMSGARRRRSWVSRPRRSTSRSREAPASRSRAARRP